MKKLFLSLIASSIFASSWALTTITTKNVSTTNLCGGASINVSYVVDAPANAGNVFTAQLSDKMGSFAAPVSIGTLTSTGSGTIACTIPVMTASSVKYQVRVIASNPSVIGTPAVKKLKINQKPTGLTLTGVTACAATLNWTSTGVASSYKVQYKAASSADWSATIDVGLATSYTFTGLSAGTSYNFQVRAACTSGAKSDWSKITSSTAACPTPTGLIVTAIGITTTTLDWADAPCSAGYKVQYRICCSGAWTTISTTASVANLTGLLPATLYEAQVSTNCGSTTSAWTSSAMWETNYFRVAGNTELGSTFSVYPNPSNGEFTVKYNSSTEDGIVEINVQNVYGQVVLHTSRKSITGLNEEKISLGNAAAGLYYVSIKSGDKEFKSSLVVN